MPNKRVRKRVRYIVKPRWREWCVETPPKHEGKPSQNEVLPKTPLPARGRADKHAPKRWRFGASQLVLMYRGQATPAGTKTDLCARRCKHYNTTAPNTMRRMKQRAIINCNRIICGDCGDVAKWPTTTHNTIQKGKWASLYNV